MGLLLENIGMALSSIKANKMRAFLTMLGIIIGIASVITISSLGDSINSTMNKFFSTFGKNRIIIYPKSEDANYSFTYSDLFSKDDIEIVKKQFPDIIGYAAPNIGNQAQDVVKNNQKAGITTVGVDYQYFDYVKGYDFIHGRKLTEHDVKNRAKNIIVSDEFAKKLFFKTDCTGEVVHIKSGDIDSDFTIVGVYHKEKTIFDNMNSGNKTEVFMPYTIFKEADMSFTLDIFLYDHVDLNKETENIKNFIERYKQKQNFYKVESLQEQVAQVNQIFGMLSLGLGAIAAISLIVGGIGIMNIMLVSVTERTREIGIRKSLGARKKDILSQFLVESIVLSGVGGIIGTIIGLMLSFVFATFIKTDPTIPIKPIVIAVLFSAFVGIFFGLYPANKAAKLDPIDALRYE